MNMMPIRRNDRIPAIAATLGMAGLVPFVAGAILIWFAPVITFGLSVPRLVIVYGAVILSFIGGMLWGLVSAETTHDSLSGEKLQLYALAILQALAGWIAAFLPDHIALVTLAVSFALVLLVDRQAVLLGLAPVWWMKLRLRLSFVVVLSLSATAFAEALR
jgi:hypothetical protein